MSADPTGSGHPLADSIAQMQAQIEELKQANQRANQIIGQQADELNDLTRLIEGVRLKLCSVGLSPSHYDTLEKATESAMGLIRSLRDDIARPAEDIVSHVLRTRGHYELKEELAREKARLDWLQDHPRKTEVHIDGVVTEAHAYAIVTALPLRDSIDVMISREKERKE